MEIKQYAALVWRWAWLIILGAVIAGGIAYIVSINTTPVYATSARLLIDEAPGSSAGNDYSQILLEQKLAQTYVEIINTRQVREATIEQLGLPLTQGQLGSMVSVSSVPETQLLTIRVEDTDPERAALIANTIGAVFIQQNQERENLRYAEPLSNWQSRLDELALQISEIETEIAPLVNTEDAAESVALSRLETRLNEARIQYTEAFNNLNDLQISQAKESSNLIQIEEAQPNSIPIRPRTSTNTLLAIVVGAMLAIGIVFLIEYLDDTIKSPQDIAADTDLSTLGTIAVIRSDTPDDRLITHRTPRDPISEAYRVLRTNLSFSAVDDNLHTVLVTSSSPSEGKSTSAANLGVVIAQTGKRVIIVDSDLRRPVQHKIFGVTNNQGLTTAILDNRTPVSYHIQPTKIPDLQVMPSGPIPPNPAELLNSQRMEQVLAELKTIADVVIFDTPPVLSVADASILASKTDGVLLVAEAKGTKRHALMESVNRLRASNAHIFGVVVNKFDPGRSGYYYKYQYYYYTSTKEYAQNPRRKNGRKLPKWIPGFNKR
jgi:non-specific protein-tyrosine kinase